MKKINAMILAAGYGTRFTPYTNKLPKPCIPFLNNPLIYYSISLAKQLPLNNLVINLHHLPNKLKKTVNDYNFTSSQKKRLFFSYEKKQILGSAGGLLKAKKYLNTCEHFLVLNGDTIILPDLFFKKNNNNKKNFDIKKIQKNFTDNNIITNIIRNLYEYHLTTNSMATFMVVKNNLVGEKYSGLWANDTNQLKYIGKNPDKICINKNKKLKPYHFVGIQILSSKIFNFFPLPDKGKVLHLFQDIITPLIKENYNFKVFPSHSIKWFETGNLNDYLNATKKCLLGDKILLGKNCKISPDVKIKGFLVCGDNVTIPNNCSLENVVIIPNKMISSNINIKNEIII